MFLKSLLAIIIIIIRLLVSVKVITWLILKFISEIPHPISEIESYIVIILLDVWVFSSIIEVQIKNNQE
jgi:hypothetical protein